MLTRDPPNPLVADGQLLMTHQRQPDRSLSLTYSFLTGLPTKSQISEETLKKFRKTPEKTAIRPPRSAALTPAIAYRALFLSEPFIPRPHTPRPQFSSRILCLFPSSRTTSVQCAPPRPKLLLQALSPLLLSPSLLKHNNTSLPRWRRPSIRKLALTLGVGPLTTSKQLCAVVLDAPSRSGAKALPLIPAIATGAGSLSSFLAPVMLTPLPFASRTPSSDLDLCRLRSGNATAATAAAGPLSSVRSLPSVPSVCESRWSSTVFVLTAVSMTLLCAQQGHLSLPARNLSLPQSTTALIVTGCVYIG